MMVDLSLVTIVPQLRLRPHVTEKLHDARERQTRFRASAVSLNPTKGVSTGVAAGNTLGSSEPLAAGSFT